MSTNYFEIRSETNIFTNYVISTPSNSASVNWI